MHTSWFLLPTPYTLFSWLHIIPRIQQKKLFLLLTNSAENLASLQLSEAWRNERGETHFLCRKYCLFFVPILMLLCGMSNHVFLNGFGGSSSLVFLSHTQTCSFPPPTHPIASILWLHNCWYSASHMHPSTYFSVFCDS